MGSYDSAETCELVVCHTLSQLHKEIKTGYVVFYRDDGLAVSHNRPQEIEKTKKKIRKIFEKIS